MRRFAVAAVLVALSGGAQAQGLSFVGTETQLSQDPATLIPPYFASGTPVDPANTYIFTQVPSSPVGNGGQNRTGILRLSDLLGQQAGVTPVQLSAALAGIASRIDRLNNRFSEAVALAGSFNVLPPNPGDRFAVSVGGAGYNGFGAASISASARITEEAVAYVGVARGPTQTMVKGGMGWSFR